MIKVSFMKTLSRTGRYSVPSEFLYFFNGQTSYLTDDFYCDTQHFYLAGVGNSLLVSTLRNSFLQSFFLSLLLSFFYTLSQPVNASLTAGSGNIVAENDYIVQMAVVSRELLTRHVIKL